MRYACVGALVAGALCFVPSAISGQSGTKLPWAANYEALSQWEGFRNTTGAATVSAGCQIGGCLRAPLVQGTLSENYGDFYFGDHSTVRGPKVEEVWYTVWSKFDSGLSWPSGGHKIALLNLTDGVSSERRYQVILLVHVGQYALQITDIANWRFYDRHQNVGTIRSQIRYNEWDKLKVHVRLNSPGSANGVVRMWVNGQLRLEHTDINIRYNTAYGVNKFIVGGYATPSSPSNGVQWFDDVNIATSDPDGGATTLPPGAPRNVRIVR